MRYMIKNSRFYFGYWQGTLSLWFISASYKRPYIFNTRAEAEFVLEDLAYFQEDLTVVEIS